MNLRQIGDGNPAQQIAINAWEHHRGIVGDDPAEEFVDARFVVAGEVAGNGPIGGKQRQHRGSDVHWATFGAAGSNGPSQRGLITHDRIVPHLRTIVRAWVRFAQR